VLEIRADWFTLCGSLQASPQLAAIPVASYATNRDLHWSKVSGSSYGNHKTLTAPAFPRGSNDLN
jgi:hypothetical protein